MLLNPEKPISSGRVDRYSIRNSDDDGFSSIDLDDLLRYSKKKDIIKKYYNIEVL